MKDNGFFYSIAIIAALGILIGFLNYTKGAIHQQVPRASDVVFSGEKNQRRATSSKSTATAETTPVEKAACGCCLQRRKRIEQRRQQVRERKEAKERASSKAP